MSERREHPKGIKYPRSVPIRYEVRTGKWGAYFHDTKRSFDLNLQQVANELNLHEERKAQLRWYVETYGENPLPTPDTTKER